MRRHRARIFPRWYQNATLTEPALSTPGCLESQSSTSFITANTSPGDESASETETSCSERKLACVSGMCGILSSPTGESMNSFLTFCLWNPVRQRGQVLWSVVSARIHLDSLPFQEIYFWLVGMNTNDRHRI